MRVLVVDDLSVITIFRIAHLPQTGSNVVADGASIWVSGVAANLAWAGERLLYACARTPCLEASQRR